MKKLRIIPDSGIEHYGPPHGLEVLWGWLGVGRTYDYRYGVMFKAKFNNKKYTLTVALEKQLPKEQRMGGLHDDESTSFGE